MVLDRSYSITLQQERQERMLQSFFREHCRIGVFYDGGYFHRISNYYLHSHPIQRRINVNGLHTLIRNYVADAMARQPHTCQVVDAHYFGTTYQYDEYTQNESFFRVLSNLGFNLHLRMPGADNREKGVDTAYSLKAFIHTFKSRLDMTVLVAGDNDFLPLVDELQAFQQRVTVIAGNFTSRDSSGRLCGTRSASALSEKADCSINLDTAIDRLWKACHPLLDILFL